MENVLEEEEHDDTSLSHEDAPSTSASTVSIVGQTSKPIGHLPTDTADDDTNADCAFLNDVQAVIEKHSGKTSALFLPFLCQMKDTVTKARRCLKKRVMNADEKTEEA